MGLPLMSVYEQIGVLHGYCDAVSQLARDTPLAGHLAIRKTFKTEQKH